MIRIATLVAVSWDDVDLVRNSIEGRELESGRLIQETATVAKRELKTDSRSQKQRECMARLREKYRTLGLNNMGKPYKPKDKK